MLFRPGIAQSVSVRATFGLESKAFGFRHMKKLFLLPKRRACFCLSQRFSGVLSPGAKRRRRESTRSGLFISEVKKEWSNALTPLYSSRGAQTANVRLA